MKNKIYYILILIFLFSIDNITAQDPMGLYYMNTIPQSSHLNPAMQPRAHSYISLISVTENFKSDAAFKNLVQQNGKEWVLPYHKDYSFRNLKMATGKSLDFHNNIDIGLLGFGFRLGSNYFTFDTKVKTNFNLGIPYDFISVAERGFPNDKTFNLSPLKTNVFGYIETSLGFSREINDNLTVGAKIKPLIGLTAANTKTDNFTLHTSRDYWEVDYNGSVSTSGPFDFTITKDEVTGDYDAKFEFYEDDEIVDYFTSFDNLGFAADFGVDYKINHRWSVSASLVDFGYIRWKSNDSYNFNFKYSFDGIEGEGIKEEFDDELDKILDEIKESFSHAERDNYTTNLAPQLYVGTQFEVTPYFDLGLLSRNIFYKDNFRQDFNISANFQPYSFMSANINYSLRPRGGNGLGTALMFLLGPLQFYTALDYIPTKYSDLYEKGNEEQIGIMFPNARNINFKVGLNLIFNRHGYKDRPMLYKY